MNKIDFKYISSLFDDTWDIGYLSAEGLYRASLAPIKHAFHVNGANFTNDIHFKGLTNTLIFVKQGHSWDYSHYEECESILESNTELGEWFPIYTNYKEAAILSGIGVRARNSLVYSYKFGFDMHICAVGFKGEIVNFPTNKRINHKLWSRCKSCYDCVEACPVNAIHGREEPYWLNSSACDTFIGVGEHPKIPSVYTYWRKHVYPEEDFTEEEARKIALEQKMPFNRKGYTFDGNSIKKDGKIVYVPVCRECTSQLRCSKWGGNFPYQDTEIKTEHVLKFVKNFKRKEAIS